MQNNANRPISNLLKLLMLVIKSQKKEFDDLISNASIDESEKKKFQNWVVNSPIDIYIPRIPPVGCLISAGWCQGDYNGYVFDILANIDQFDWMSYINKEYSYISKDSEVINYLNWIGDIPTGRFLIDKRTEYYEKKASKKISVSLIKVDDQFYEIKAERKVKKIAS